MTDLDLIKKLEQNFGFVFNRLTCDGNIYAKKIKLHDANRVFGEFVMAFAHLRGCLVDISPGELSRAEIAKNIDSFDIDEWND